jgi:hypothetical protein
MHPALASDTRTDREGADRAARGTPDAAARMEHFDPSTLGSCDEPVRRYFTHAIAQGTTLQPRMTLLMHGRIKPLGLWLPFTARQECDGSSFTWRAQVPRHVRLLTVTDSYDNGHAAMEGRLLGPLRIFHGEDENVVRAAAARAATEGILAPIGLLPSRTCIWHAESDNHIVVNLELAPERPEMHLVIDYSGAVQSASLQRWGNAGQNHYGYIPFGGDVLAEKRFGDLVLPARLRVGWWYGTERYKPFFEAEITHATSGERSGAGHDDSVVGRLTGTRRAL